MFLLLCTTLEHINAVSINSYHPSSGPITGGTVITITGENFVERGTSRSRCRFQVSGSSRRVAIINIVFNSTYMTCTMPDVSSLFKSPLMSDGANLQLFLTGANSQLSSSVSFYIFDLSFISISAVIPNQALTNSSSTYATIHGSSFF